MNETEHLIRWVREGAVHNGGDAGSEEGQCCPDFSCCVENVKSLLVERTAYMWTNGVMRLELNYAFMRRALKQQYPDGEDEKITLAGEDAPFYMGVNITWN